MVVSVWVFQFLNFLSGGSFGKDRLSQAYHLATEAAQKAREQQKEGYDIRFRGAVIKPDYLCHFVLKPGKLSSHVDMR
jgi:hypothetical protein